MGVAISRYSEIGANELVRRFCGPEPLCPNDPYWNQLLAYNLTPPATAEQQLMLDASTEPLLQQFLQHNPHSGNLGSLVQALITRATQLLAAPTTDNAMLCWQTFNALLVVRCVCKYLVEVVGEQQLCAHLDAAPPAPTPSGGQSEGAGRGASPRDSRVEMLMDTLVSLLIDVPLNDTTYYLHLECLSTMLVLLSVYMFAPTHGHAHLVDTSLIYRTVFGGRYTLHASLLVRTLVGHVTSLDAAPPTLFGTHAPHGSVLIDIAAGLWSMLSPRAPARPSLHTHPPADRQELLARLRTDHPVATQSCLLLLALTHHCMDRNLYRTALLSAQDAQETSSTPGKEEETDPTQPAPLRIDMAAFHKTLCATAGCEHFTLLLYVMLHSSAAYRSHVTASPAPRIHALLVPILRVVYLAPSSSAHHVYMALIVLLILTEDDRVIRALHDIMLKNPTWYSERSLSEISLGGLSVLVVLRALHYNLARVRDKYLHTNCLAAIANMSCEFRNLHPYVCQRLLGLLEILTKRRARLCARIEGDVEGEGGDGGEGGDAKPPPFGKDNTDEIMEHIGVLDEVIRMLLEIINSTLTHQLTHNLNLVYALLHKKQLFEHHQNQPITQNIDMVIGFFSSRLQRVCEAGDGAQLGPSDVMAVLKRSAAHWSTDRLKKFPSLKFRYVEEDRPEEFFTPYVWSLAAGAGTLHWAAEGLPLIAV